MSGAVQAGCAFATAGAAGLALTPAAMRIAERTGMLDRPQSWKTHVRPTPYLGGVAVVGAFLLAAAVYGDGLGDHLPILLGAIALSIVGMVDDRIHVRPLARVACEASAGLLLWATGLGWDVAGVGVIDAALTVAWVLALVNATNLLDLMDGVAGSTSAAALAGAAVFALAGGAPALAALLAAMAGAVCGFLRFNMARPSRIFLGDGGSMPLGFVVAAGTAGLPYDDGLGTIALLAGTLVVAVPLLDMTFRIFLRLRRGVSLMTAGPDSLANRTRDHVHTPARVAAIAAGVQAALAVAAALAADDGRAATVIVFVVCSTIGVTIASLLQLTAPDRVRSPATGAMADSV